MTENKTHFSGIEQRYYVCCSVCSAEDRIYGNSILERHHCAESLNWRYLKAQWFCPQCANQYNSLPKTGD